MKREEIVEFLKDIQDGFLSGKQSEVEWEKTGEVFGQLRKMKMKRRVLEIF